MLQNRIYLPWLFALALLPAIACGAVYRVVDENGNITFTDNPPADNPTTENIDLPVVNTQPSPLLSDQPEKSEEDQADTSYSSVSIISPENESTITPGQVTVNVRIETEPALHLGHNVQLWFNNQPYGKPTTATNFQIGALERGEHQLQVKILDERGDTVASSGSVTIYVKRAFIKPKPQVKQNSN